MLGEGGELVVVVTLALSLCSSFLLFRRFGWFFFLANTAMLCSVCIVSIGVRMCSGAQCLAWIGG